MLRTLSIAWGSVTRQADCERCGCRFAYDVRRLGLGSGRLGLFSASKAAEGDLQNALRKADAMVACPDCGHFQAAMVRRQRWTWAKRAMALAALAGVLVVFLTPLASVNRSDAPVILAVRFWVGLAGFSAAAGAAAMVVLDNPARWSFTRKLHRGRGRSLQPGQPVPALAGAPATVSSPQGVYHREPSPMPAMQPAAPAAGQPDVGTWPFSQEDDEGLEPTVITRTCAHCGRHYKLPREKQGKRARCKCGQVIQL